MNRPRTTPFDLETLRWVLRGEASLHLQREAQGLPLHHDQLLKISWACSELAARIQARTERGSL
jgi:hypothetical protein